MTQMSTFHDLHELDQRDVPFATPSGIVMAQLRYTKWLRRLVRLILVFAIPLGIWHAGNYLIDAVTRYQALPACQWIPIPDPNKRPYSAKHCYLTKTQSLLRLYDATGRTLLAERQFRETDFPFFLWYPANFSYNDSAFGDGGEISLPPTIIDRLRAQLP